MNKMMMKTTGKKTKMKRTIGIERVFNIETHTELQLEIIGWLVRPWAKITKYRIKDIDGKKVIMTIEFLRNPQEMIK